MYENIKWMKIKYWILRNVFFYNRPIRALHGQCMFCEGSYFKKEDALSVETWNMPGTDFNRLKYGEDKERYEEKYKNPGRTYFNFEEHKCKTCGQKWTSNQISSKEITYEHLD